MRGVGVGSRRAALYRLGGAAALATSLAPQARACSRPFTVVSPFGGAAFRSAQGLLRESMARLMDCPFVIEQKPGAAGVIGVRHALGLARTGDVLLLASTTTTAINPLLRSAADIGRRDDWQPVAQLYRMPIVLVAAPDAPESLAALQAAGRRVTARLSYASSGVGQAYHLLMEHAKQVLGFDALHVPYKTNHAFSVAAGETQIAFASLEVTLPLIREGRLRPLAVAAPARLAVLPEVPALAERVPGFACHMNVGLLASAGMARPTVLALNAARNAALAQDAPLRLDLERAGVVVPPSHAPGEYAEDLEREHRFWQSLVQRLGGAERVRD